MNRKRRLEQGKNILIILLIISMILMGWQSRIFYGFFHSVTIFSDISGWFKASLDDGSDNASGAVATEAARPLFITVTNDSGRHYGVKYDATARDALYDNTGSLFGDALGSADVPVLTGENMWESALGSAGVYYSYATPVMLALLAEWLGTEITGEWGKTEVRRLCISAAGEKCFLYFQDDETGLFYQEETAVTKSSVEARVEQYETNSALFAFELGTNILQTDADQLLMIETSAHPVIKASNPVSAADDVETILSDLGAATYANSGYPESDGTKVVVGNDFVIRIRPGGLVIYRSTETDRAEEVPLSDSEIIELARSMVADTIGRHCGDATISFTSLAAGESGEYVVTFDYYVAGGRIYCDDGVHAAEITVMNGEIAEADLMFREYEVTDQMVTLLPEIQAAAAAVVLLPEIQAVTAAGGELMLSYSDVGSDLIIPEWIVLSD